MVIYLKILKRVIDKNKVVIGYLIETDNNIIKVASVSACKKYNCVSPFTNATLHSDGRFIAKAGERIETISVEDAHKITRTRNTEVLEPVVVNISMFTKAGSSQNEERYKIRQEIAGSETVSICRKLRTALRQNRLIVDTSRHSSNYGYNQHLFGFIRSCGLDVETFIKTYIYNMQPCTLVLDKSVHAAKSSGDFNVILDIGYRVALYIKVSKSGDYIVSFHDSNDKGVGRTNAKRFKQGALSRVSNDYAYILLNEPIRPAKPGEFYDIRMSRGLSVLKQSLEGAYCDKDLICVRTQDLFDGVKRLMLSFLTKLEVEFSDDFRLRGTRTAIERRNNLDSFSFTSYGNSILAKISLLVDVYPLTTSQTERQSIMTIAGFLIDEMLFVEDKVSLLNMLKGRYMGYSNGVLERIYILLGD